MARALYVAPHDPVTAAQLAALRRRVAELEAEVSELRAEARIAEEIRMVAAPPGALV